MNPIAFLSMDFKILFLSAFEHIPYFNFFLDEFEQLKACRDEVFVVDDDVAVVVLVVGGFGAAEDDAEPVGRF